LRRDNEQLLGLRKRLRHPGRQLQEYAQRLDTSEARMTRAARQGIHLRRARLAQSCAELNRHQPTQRVKALHAENRQLERRLKTAVQHLLRHYQQQLGATAQELNALSPLETLQRGYAIVRNQEQHIIRRATQAQVGEKVTAKLGAGLLHCSVEEIEP